MGIGVSVFLIAAGAIMAFAVQTTSSHGFNIYAAGIILMVIGLVSLVTSALIFGPRSRRTVVQDDNGRRVTSVTRDEF